MTKLEQLVIRRAELLRQIKALKPAPELDHCRYVPNPEDWNICENCIQHCYRLTVEHNSENRGHDWMHFYEMFSEMDREPCAACVEILRLKKLKVPLKRELGNVNSQITQIGNRLIKSSGQ